MSKKPDYLTLCSIAAQKAGTSYGKYMAMHGYHPPIQADGLWQRRAWYHL